MCLSLNDLYNTLNGMLNFNKSLQRSFGHELDGLKQEP